MSEGRQRCVLNGKLFSELDKNPSCHPTESTSQPHPKQNTDPDEPKMTKNYFTLRAVRNAG
jgi:hypothetical protein